VSWAGPARVIRSQILGLRNELYVEAARSIGAGEWRILTRHILPGAANMTSSQFALVASNAILAEASLSFLGLGDPTAKSWGSMLYFAQARGAFLNGSWLWWVLPPGILIMLAILGLVLVSYALEERFEPGLRY
jgi:peptide/nickel transport system permease protein